MSERNWTAGPWTVSPGRDAQEWSIDALDGDEDLNHISWSGLAVVYGSDDYPKKGAIKAKANAHLIAAAPELYDSADYAKDVLRDIVEGKVKTEDARSCLKKIEAALAKARGEQP